MGAGASLVGRFSEPTTDRHNTPRTRKVLVAGLENAGKTSIINKLAEADEFAVSIADPTTQFPVTRYTHRACTFMFWDVSDQNALMAHRRDCFAGANCIIFAVDGVDRSKLDLAGVYLRALTRDRHAAVRLIHNERLRSDKMPSSGSYNLQKVPIIVLINKGDIASCITTVELSLLFDLETILAGRYWRVLSGSSSTGEGLVEVLEWLVENT